MDKHQNPGGQKAQKTIGKGLETQQQPELDIGKKFKIITYYSIRQNRITTQNALMQIGTILKNSGKISTISFIKLATLFYLITLIQSLLLIPLVTFSLIKSIVLEPCLAKLS